METDRILGASRDLTLPVVRFYTWENPTISFGLNQNPCNRLDIKRCLSDGIEVVARPTGGREILHGWDLCCSVIWPVVEKRSAVESRELLDRINGILSRGLIEIGIDARTHSVTKKAGIDNGPCFSQIDRGEISVSGKKIVASAQRIFNRAVLQQSSISVERPDCDLMDYLVMGRDSRMRDRIVNSTAFIEEDLEETLAIPEIVKVLKEAFESELGESALFEMPDK
jgi:lipoate-protein ligase A